MPKQRDGHLPVRSRLAMALLKGGLALGVVWVVALIAFFGRVVLAIL